MRVHTWSPESRAAHLGVAAAVRRRRRQRLQPPALPAGKGHIHVEQVSGEQVGLLAAGRAPDLHDHVAALVGGRAASSSTRSSSSVAVTASSSSSIISPQLTARRAASANPCALRSRVPRLRLAYKRTESRRLPPSKRQAGTPSALPAKSHNAWSTALRAVAPTRPVSPEKIADPRAICSHNTSTWVGSAPTNRGPNCSSAAATKPSLPLWLASPSPLSRRRCESARRSKCLRCDAATECSSK